MEKIDIGWVDGGYVNSRFASSMAGAAADMQYFEALGAVRVVTGVSLVTSGRNILVHEFLRGDSDWLWMVDSDMEVGKGHWLDLVNMAEDKEADLVSGLAFIYKNGVLIPSIFYEMGPPFFEEGTVVTKPTLPENGATIDAAGLATTLIHRRVFEGLTPPRHEEYPWFDQIILPSGQLSGEDNQFFLRAKKAGFKTVINTEAVAQHLKEVGMGIKEYHRQQAMLDAS